MADSTPQLRVVKGSSEADINTLNQWMRSQPWYQQLLQQWGVNPASVKLSEDQRKAIIKAAQAAGVQVDEGNIEVDPAGNFNPIGHKARNFAIGAGIAGAAIGAPYLIGALTSGGAAGAGAAGAGSAAGGAAAGTAGAAGAGAGAGVSGAALGAGAASAAPSLWSKIAGPLISTAVPAAAGLIGTKMQVDANQKASDAEAKAAQDALDWQKQQYGVRQEQLAPTIGVGNAARVRLGELMGLAAPEGGWHAPAATQPTAPQGVIPPAGQTPATPAPPTLVTMKAPNGQVAQVPSDQVPHYQQQGAQVVPAGLPAY